MTVVDHPVEFSGSKSNSFCGGVARNLDSGDPSLGSSGVDPKILHLGVFGILAKFGSCSVEMAENVSLGGLVPWVEVGLTHWNIHIVITLNVVILL